MNNKQMIYPTAAPAHNCPHLSVRLRAPKFNIKESLQACLAEHCQQTSQLRICTLHAYCWYPSLTLLRKCYLLLHVLSCAVG